MVNKGITLSIRTITGSIANFTTTTELLYMISGSAELELRGQTTRLEAEDVLAINRGESFTLLPEQQCSLCCISIDPALIVENCGKYMELSCDSRKEEKDSYFILRQKLRQVMLDNLRNDGKQSFAYTKQFCDAADYLFREFGKDSERVGVGDIVPIKTNCRIEKIVEYIHNNYQEQITLTALANAFHISDSHLSRQMKLTMGIGFREYLCKVRLQHAVEDLLKTDKLVISIANDNGFPGISAFNKAFKDEFGVTPSAFRKDHAQEEQQDDNGAKKALLEDLEQIENEKSAETLTRNDLHITVDTQMARPCVKPWQNVVNVGSASDLLDPRMQKQILQLKEELHFTYVRVWGLFLEDMMVVVNQKNRTTYFKRIDEMLSFLLANNMIPFLQLGPKPRTKIGAVGETTYPQIKADKVVGQLSIGQWQLFLDDLMSHLLSKFGGQEVEKWIFEMWAPCWWDQGWENWYSEERFATVYHTIKRYIPSGMVGGCEFTECCHGERLAQTAKRWAELHVDPDFISFAVFPYEHKPGMVRAKWQAGKGYLRSLLNRIREEMEQAGLGDKKLFFTNWNMSISGRNLLNDSVYKGCYILENAMSVMEDVDMMAYWTVSDIYSEYVDTDAILFGGLGLVTIDGFHKPAYYALQFLNKLRSQLLNRGDNYIISCNQYGVYTIVYHNICELGYFAYLKNEAEFTFEDLNMVCEKTPPMHLEIKIQNVRNGIYNVRHQKVTKDYGSILDVWNSFGGFRELNAEDRAYINARSVPNREFSRIRVYNSVMDIAIDAASNEFGILEIMFQQK